MHRAIQSATLAALLLASPAYPKPGDKPAREEIQRHYDEVQARKSAQDRAYDRAMNLLLVDRKAAQALVEIDRAFTPTDGSGFIVTNPADAYAMAAEIRLETGYYSRAAGDLGKAEALGYSDNAKLRQLRIEIERAMGNFAEASRTLRSFGPDVLDPAKAGQSETLRVSLLVVKRYNFFLAEAKNRRAWGDFAGAREMFETALSLDNKSSEILREYATCLLAMNDTAAALGKAHEALYLALHIRGTSRRRPRAAWLAVGDTEILACLRTAAICARSNRDFSAADLHLDTALTLAIQLGLDEEARLIELERARLWLDSNSPLAPNITGEWLAKILDDIRGSPQSRIRIEAANIAGELAFRKELYPQTVDILDAAVAEIERVRASASFEDKRHYLALQSDNYRRLIAAQVRLGHPWEALVASESLKARQLRELLTPGDASAATPDDLLTELKSFQHRLAPTVAAVNYANADWSGSPPVAIVVTRDSISAIELPTLRIRLALKFLDPNAVIEAQKRDVDAVRYGNPDQITLAGLIAYYRECIDAPQEQLMARIEPMLHTSRALHDTLFDPIQAALKGRRRLLVAPNGLLSYLPFDTLVDAQDRMLVQGYAFTLTPSFLTTISLADRPPATYDRSMIAFGGAVYNPADYEQTMAQVDALKTQFALISSVRGNTFAGADRSPYAGVFGGPMNNLAGTKAEVEMLGQLLPDARVITGPAVNESHIVALARSGELRHNRVIHFAVHGASLPAMPELSCIALSYEGHYTKTLPASRDGLLQITEIQALPLRADLVTLSACQTGLGAIFSGEGVVGLTTAFLTAGADRITASLWPVNDTSTTFFMQHFYRMLLIDHVPGDVAITKVKQEFVSGKIAGFGHPKYWAPFNLYGGGDLLDPREP